jgi:hypothetical protein
MPAKPHISPALLALRGWITAASVVLAACALAQLIIFAIARYTDARVEDLQLPTNSSIVTTKDHAPGLLHSKHKQADQVDPNRVRSLTDYNLAVTSSTISTAGLVSAIVLMLATGLGAIVAGGGAVPGVALAVRAFVWAAVCFGLCFPWSGVAGKAMAPGIFCGYDILTLAADSGGGTATIAHVFLPTAVCVLAGCVAFWFRRGCASGVILTSLSEVDEALEREMSMIRERGVGHLSAASRGTGALRQTIAPERVAIPEPGPLRKAAGAESMSDEDMNVAPSLTRRKNPPSRPI